VNPLRQYQHPIIQKAINIMWFKNKGDDGVTFQEHFSPLPVPTIALVLAVVGTNIVPDYRKLMGVLTIIRHNAASTSGPMEHAGSPVGMKNVSRLCTAPTLSRSVNFRKTRNVAIHWKKYGATFSEMPGRIRYRVLYRMVGRFSHTSTSDYAEIGRPDTPGAPDAEEDEDLPAYPGVEVPTISVADES